MVSAGRGPVTVWWCQQAGDLSPLAKYIIIPALDTPAVFASNASHRSSGPGARPVSRRITRAGPNPPGSASAPASKKSGTAQVPPPPCHFAEPPWIPLSQISFILAAMISRLLYILSRISSESPCPACSRATLAFPLIWAASSLPLADRTGVARYFAPSWGSRSPFWTQLVSDICHLHHQIQRVGSPEAVFLHLLRCDLVPISVNVKNRECKMFKSFDHNSPVRHFSVPSSSINSGLSAP